MKKGTIYLSFLMVLIFSTAHSQESVSADMKNVIQLLKLESTKIDFDHSIEKPLRYIPEMMGFALIERVSDEPGLGEYNCHMVLYNASTKEITNKYVFPLETDVMQLTEVNFDFAPYMVKNSTRAIGLRFHMDGPSKPNPFSEEKFYLFVSEKNTFVPVIKEFTSYQYAGEWDMDCAGEFNETNAYFIMLPSATNGYNDIQVNLKKVNTIRKFVAGECEAKETGSKETVVLTFQNGAYSIKK